MKKRLITIFAAILILLIGCVKDPAKLGIHPNTIYKGRVIEKSQNKPIKGVTVSVTDGSHVHVSQVTGDDGRFEFRVDFDAIDDQYSLQLDCQGYASIKEELKGFGQESYDYRDIVYYDNSDPNNWPNVTTAEVVDITSTSARTGGTITYYGAAEITARGVCWGTAHNPSIDGDLTTDGSGTGSFSSDLNNLSINTIYYVRAYATNLHGTYYGEERSFTTVAGLPTVITNTITSITPVSAVGGGIVTADNGFNVTERGICWSTFENPTVGDNYKPAGSGIGEFNCEMIDLSSNKTYYVRAYATNSNGTVYGENVTFTTIAGDITVSTNEVTNVTPVSATCGGTITLASGNNLPITARGVCFGTNHNPTIDDNHTSDGTGVGSYTSLITGLTVNTNYYVRAYATNEVGTFYGEEKNFNTTMGLATVTTKDIMDIHPLSATGGGIVTADNGFTVTSRGLCWSVVQNPTIDDSHTTNGSGIGEFNGFMENLQNSTTYHIRAYATNANGTAYGEDKMYTTTSGAITVTTNTVTDVTASSATCGGNATITNDNNLPITAKGVCWSTNHNPSINDNHSNDGSGIGAFNSSITGLSVNTTYYVRAYATNQIDTYYGSEKTFVTSEGLPSVVLDENSFTLLSSTSVSCTSNVTSNGGFAVTARGICWGDTPNPTITDNHTNDGTGIGYYTSVLSDLDPTHIYYVRSYVTNTTCTAYSNQVMLNMEYMLLPSFTFNGHVYKVAPDPQQQPNQYLSWSQATAYCEALTIYGYADWRMPNIEELEMMYQNRYSIGGFVESSDYNIYYHSSTPYSSTIHYQLYWNSGGRTYDYDIENYGAYMSGPILGRAHVRPIRIDH